MIAADKKVIERSSQIFFSGTILSRITGLFRDILTAYVFGSSAAIAALMVAFRFSSLFRRIFGEGALHAAFVPAYEKIRLKSDADAARFFVDLSTLLAFTLLSIILISEIALGGLLSAHLLKADNTQIIFLTMVLLPTLFFICNAAFCSSLLQCHDVFFLPAVSPAVFNLFWIIGVWYLKNRPIDQAVHYLSIWILVGVSAQLIVLLPQVYDCLKSDFTEQLSFSLTRLKKSFRSVAKPLGLGIIGVSTTQINSALDSIFARMISLEGPAYLWYAIRIQQVPLALFGVAMAGALLPPLTRAFSRSRGEYSELLNYSLARAVGLLTPCLVALMLTAAACVNLLYGRGEFNLISAHQTTYCLWAYTLGLLPQGLILILGPAFYVQNRYYRTTRASVLALFLNVFLNIFFAFIMKLPTWSVAIATTISSWFQAIYLFHYLLKGIELKRFKTFIFSSIQVVVLTVISGYFTYYLTVHLNPGIESLLYFPRGIKLQLSTFIVQTATFLIILFGLAAIFRVREILALMRYLPFVKGR
ncbi:MAG: lipid II flippase MurJ [Chlamydiae bacterium]|nr:lipid II flippase MurJ [Chlamydiota bacterium]